MSIDLEFAIKQDIRNNPVVREVDVEQKREFLRVLGWACLVVLMLVVALAPRFRVVSVGYRVEDLRKDIEREEALRRQFQLELEQMLRPQVLQPRAARLGMIEPGEHDLLVIERVPAPATPDRAIVAAAR